MLCYTVKQVKQRGSFFGKICPGSGWAHKACYVMALLGLSVTVKKKSLETHTATGL